MSEENQTPEVQEIDLLKARADKLGVSYSNNIGVDKLKERINAHMEGKDEVVTEKPVSVTKHSARKKAFDEAHKKILVRVSLMNQRKAGLPGEIVSFINDVVGVVKYYVPFDEEAYEDGYFLPNCVVQHLKEKKYLSTRNVKDKATGRTTTKTSFVKEFAIEILPTPTKEDLAKLAARQKAHNSIE